MPTFNGPDDAFGTNQADLFNGSHSDDVFFALEGNDTLKGEGGNDILYGYEGNDSIQGGTGSDTLYGDEGNDNIKGGTGSDEMYGGSGDDTLFGESSFSSVVIDTLQGGEGADLFILGDYHDNLYSTSGNADYALIRDLQAEDTIRLDYGTYDFAPSPIEGVDGTGIYEGSELIAVLAGVDAANLTATNEGYYTNVTGFRSSEIYGTEGHDNLLGESSDDIIYGLGGDDTLQGSSGSVFGEEVDQYIGGHGSDIFVLGNFHDNYYDNAGAEDYALIKDLQSNDTIRLDSGNYELTTSTIHGIEGTAIYEGEELIAIVEGVEAEELTTSEYSYYTHITTSGSLTIEAEDLNLETYTVQNFGELPAENGAYGADAVGITLYDGETVNESGTASLLASDYGLSGTYDLSVSYFDENDGTATLQVLVNHEVVDEILFSEETSSGYPTEDTRREYTFDDLAIESTDTVSLRGIADINHDGSEWARVDYISFALDTEINDFAAADV